MVLNKSDLWHGLEARANTAKMAVPQINISAKLGTGIDRLYAEIQRFAGIENFDLNQAVFFTSRQEELLKKLIKAKSEEAAHSIITELLSGPVNV